jgi:hypothetical protein
VTRPAVENQTDGRVLMLDYTVDQDRYVRFDLAAGSVTLDDGTDLQYTVMYPESTWWDGEPGLAPNATSTLRLSGDVIADPARAEVTFYPAHA